LEIALESGSVPGIILLLMQWRLYAKEASQQARQALPWEEPAEEHFIKRRFRPDEEETTTSDPSSSSLTNDDDIVQEGDVIKYVTTGILLHLCDEVAGGSPFERNHQAWDAN
jgi:hypothetical protein